MTETAKLQLLIAYDAERNEYAVSNHNLEPEKAAQFIAELGPHLRSGCRFLVIDQSHPHKRPAAQQCRTCRDQVQRSSGLQPPPKFTRRKS